jgi:hypothetical protein
MVNYLIVLFAVTLVYFCSAERLIIYVRLIGLQGLLMCGIAIFELDEVNTANIVFIVAETLVFKNFLKPYLLSGINSRHVMKVHRQAMLDLSSDLPTFALLISVTLKCPRKSVCKYDLYGHSLIYFVYRVAAYCNP